jgi:hypothetical protein
MVSPRARISLVVLASIAASFAACKADSAATSTSASTGGAAGGGAGGAGGAAGFTYTPEGCGYDVTMDATRGADFSADAEGLGSAPAPARVRLGLGGGIKLGEAGYADPSKCAALVWDTDVATLGSKVRIGTAKESLDRTAVGFSYTLAGSVPTRVHRVDLCGLTPKTTYYYQVGGGPAGKEVFADVRSFTTAAAPEAGGEVVIGVSGDSRDSLDVVWPLVQTRMAKAGVDFQLFSGDSIIDLLPDASETDYQTWFDGAAKAGSLGATWIAAIGGNHENLHAEWLANHALPGTGAAMGLYASFDVGPAHVVLLDDETIAADTHIGLAPTTKQEVLDWLEADLAAADARRGTTPWIVVTHHRGPLSTAHHSTDSDMKKVRGELLPIYDKHHVDLVLNGHDHNYERSKPASAGPDGEPVPAASEAKGTVYVVCAGAGAGGYDKGAGDVPYRAMNWAFDGKEFVGVYGLLTISGKKLAWKAMGLKPGAGGPEVDQVIDEAGWSK